MQKRLQPQNKPIIHTEPYNKSNDTEQWIRITSGCKNNCPFCYEPQEIKEYPLPWIIRNKVKIMDMNILERSDHKELLKKLSTIRYINKVVYYELICGIDWRKMTQETAYLLKKARFQNIRLAWDYTIKDQYKISDTIKYLLKAGYKSQEITIFMICNWMINVDECKRKLDLCKIWNVKVADCYFDNQLSPNIIPIHWTDQDIKKFRRSVRKHNQLVRFRIDPEN